MTPFTERHFPGVINILLEDLYVRFPTVLSVFKTKSHDAEAENSTLYPDAGTECDDQLSVSVHTELTCPVHKFGIPLVQNIQAGSSEEIEFVHPEHPPPSTVPKTAIFVPESFSYKFPFTL